MHRQIGYTSLREMRKQISTMGGASIATKNRGV
ncbi:hypothetical protein FHS45_001965 [Thalassobacillus devorans]|nr:hypothetical protein [Thalassobacillus devorans]